MDPVFSIGISSLWDELRHMPAGGVWWVDADRNEDAISLVNQTIASQAGNAKVAVICMGEIVPVVMVSPGGQYGVFSSVNQLPGSVKGVNEECLVRLTVCASNMSCRFPVKPLPSATLSGCLLCTTEVNMGLFNFVKDAGEKLWDAVTGNHDKDDLAKKVQEQDRKSVV